MNHENNLRLLNNDNKTNNYIFISMSSSCRPINQLFFYKQKILISHFIRYICSPACQNKLSNQPIAGQQHSAFRHVDLIKERR